MAPVWFAATPDSDYMFKALTDGTVSQMSGGKIPKLTAAQAAGLLGSWVIESGRTLSKGGFKNFDVIEAGSGRGRGISQYTGVRRGPYDIVAKEAQARGENVNSAQWQMQYFVNEYLGKYDKYAGGNSLVGYRRDFDPAKMQANKFGDTPQGWARYFTGSANEGFGYFRPGTPHQDWRNTAAGEVFAHYGAQQAPPPPPATAQPAPTSPAPQPNPLQILNNATKGIHDGAKKWLQKLGIKDKTSFNTDKIQRKLGNIARKEGAKSDVGFAIFNSTKGGGWKKWDKLSGSDKRAWRGLGSSLGISTKSGKGSKGRSKALDLGRDLGITTSAAGRAAAAGGDAYGKAAMNMNAAPIWKTGFGIM